MSDFDGTPAELVFELETSPGSFTDISDYVVRESIKIEVVFGKYATRCSFRMWKAGGGIVVQEWARLRVYDPDSDNGSGGFVRYFYGLVMRPNSTDNAQNVFWTVDAVDMNILLEIGASDTTGHYPNQITTQWPPGDGSPAGISDQELLWDGFTLDGTFYVGLIPTYLGGDITLSGVFPVITSLPHMKFQACTVKDALNQVRAQASVAQRPYYYVRPALDDGSHTNWDLVFHWFDEAIIPALTVIASDAPEDATHKHYLTFTRNRDGAKLVTYQPVHGANGAFGYGVNTTAETQYGRRVAGKPIVDETLLTNAECDQRGQAVVNAYGEVRETVVLATEDPLSVDLLAVPYTLQVQSSLQGGLGSPTAFAIQRVTLTFPDGVATYDFELGAAFGEFGDEKLPGFAGGASSVRDFTPPAVPTGLGTLENVYEGSQGRTSRWHIGWNQNTEGDLDYYLVDWYFHDGARWVHEYVEVPGATPNLDLPGLVPGRTYYAAVRAFDTTGNGSVFCAPISVVAAARDNPAPPTAIVYGTARWDQAGAVQPITFTRPIPNQYYTHVQVYETATPANVVQDLLISGSATSHTIYGLTRGTNYTVRLTSRTQWGDEGTSATTATFTAATESPAAPTGFTNARYGVVDDTLLGGYLKIDFTPSTFVPIGYYEAFIRRQDTSAIVWYDLLAPGATSVGAGRLPVGPALELTLITVSGWGPYPGPASTPYGFTIGAVPHDDPGDFETTDATAPTPANTIAGWTPTVTGDGTFAPTTSQVWAGTRSAQLTATVGTAQLDSRLFRARAGATYSVEFTHRALFAIGTLLVTVRWYDKTGTFLSASTVLNSAPGTSETTTKTTVVAPVNATQGVWRFLFTGNNVSGNAVIGGAPKWQRVTEEQDYGAGSIKTPALGNDQVTDAKVAASGITTATKLKPRTNDSTFVTWYDITGANEKGDIYYSPGGDAMVVTGRAGVGMTVKDGFGNQMLQNASGINLGSIADLRLGGRLALPTVAQSSDFTVQPNETLYAITNNTTATLIAASGNADGIYILANVGTGLVTIFPDGSDTIGGRSKWYLARDAVLCIQSDGGSNWTVLWGHNHTEGATFPTDGLYDGLRHYRRDLRETYYYDDSLGLWLSEFYVPVNMQKRQAAEYYTGSAEAFTGPQPFGCNLYIEGVDLGGFIGGTNDGSNYWEWEFWGIAAGNSVTVLGEQFSDDVWSANVWDHSELLLDTPLIYEGDFKDFELNMIKHGSAGNLIISLNVRARKFIEP